jgi:hypothetical protein
MMVAVVVFIAIMVLVMIMVPVTITVLIVIAVLVLVTVVVMMREVVAVIIVAVMSFVAIFGKSRGWDKCSTQTRGQQRFQQPVRHTSSLFEVLDLKRPGGISEKGFTQGRLYPEMGWRANQVVLQLW